MPTDSDTNKISNPALRVDQLWQEASKLCQMGCIREAQGLLEKIAVYSNFSHHEALNTLANIYASHINQKDTLLELWKKASLTALLEKRGSDFFKFLYNFLETDTEKKQDEIEIAIALAAKSDKMYELADNIRNSNSNDEVKKIGIVSTYQQILNQSQILEFLARNNGFEDIELSFFFVNDPNIKECIELSNNTKEYIKSFGCKIFIQHQANLAQEGISFLLKKLEDNHQDLLIYNEPAKSSLLTYLSALRFSKKQAALVSNASFLPPETDLLLYFDTQKIISSIPNMQISFDDVDINIFSLITEFFKKHEKIKEISEEPTIIKQDDNEKKVKAKSFEKLSIEESSCKKKNKSKKSHKNGISLASQVIQNQVVPFLHDTIHPLKKKKISTEKEEVSKKDESSIPLTDTEKTAISKAEMDQFWEDLSLQDVNTDDDTLPEGITTSKIALDSSSINEIIDAAVTILQQGDAKRALKLLMSVDEQNSPVKDLHYSKALCHVAIGEFLKALNSVKIELKFFPENVQAKKLLNDINNVINKL